MGLMGSKFMCAANNERKGWGQQCFLEHTIYTISNIFLITSPIQTFLQQNMILLGTCSRWGSVPVQIHHRF